jgi:hypothetical protein
MGRRITMPHTTETIERSESEVDILARLFKRNGRLPASLAHYILQIDFSDKEKALVHDLLVRNQEDALKPGEKRKLLTYVNAGTLLSILQSKARQAVKNRKR